MNFTISKNFERHIFKIFKKTGSKTNVISRIQKYPDEKEKKPL